MKISKRSGRIFTVVGICLALNLFAFIHPSLANCPSGMIAYWQLEEDDAQQGFVGYVDETSYSHTGLCSDSCPDVTFEGVVNNGQNFSGAAGITVAAHTIFNFGPSDNFSIELWMKRSPGVSASKEVFIARNDPSSGMQWWMAINTSGQAVFSMTSSAGESAIMTGSKELDDAKWHHIAVVRDTTDSKSRLYLYVDGAIETQAAPTYTSGFESSSPLTVGYFGGDMAGFYFNGFMDELAVYRGALTAQEIRMHYFLSRGYCEINNAPVKIMPLGDSITYDSHSGETRTAGQRTGYRWPLWMWLNNAGYWVDFVGSEKAGQDVIPAFDFDNAGFPGITDDQLDILLKTGVNQFPDPDRIITDGPYLPYYSPDIILLHIGTNGLKTSVSGIENILNDIDAYSEIVTVVLAKIINQIGYYENSLPSQVTSIFNANIETLVNERISNGDKIILVDMENGAGIIYELTENGGDMYDTLHPDLATNPYVVDSGYGKMADVWFNNLQDVLPQSVPPNFSSTPGTQINAGETYRYQAQLEGDPQPVVDLVEPAVPPANFVFDLKTNSISWTPGSSSSDLNIIIEAANWFGTDRQDFTVRVNNPPALGIIPDQTSEEGQLFDVVELDDYVTDPDNAPEEMTWTYKGNSDMIVVINERKATVTAPYESWYGAESITFRATDPGGLFAETTVVFTINNINDAPVIIDYTPLDIMQNTTFSIDFDMLTVIDPDNVYPDDFTLKIYGGSNYSASENLVTPVKNFVGELFIPVSVNDGIDESNIRNIVVTVVEKNEARSQESSSFCFIHTVGD